MVSLSFSQKWRLYLFLGRGVGKNVSLLLEIYGIL